MSDDSFNFLPPDNSRHSVQAESKLRAELEKAQKAKFAMLVCLLLIGGQTGLSMAGIFSKGLLPLWGGPIVLVLGFISYYSLSKKVANLELDIAKRS